MVLVLQPKFCSLGSISLNIKLFRLKSLIELKLEWSKLVILDEWFYIGGEVRRHNSVFIIVMLGTVMLGSVSGSTVFLTGSIETIFSDGSLSFKK